MLVWYVETEFCNNELTINFYITLIHTFGDIQLLLYTTLEVCPYPMYMLVSKQTDCPLFRLGTLVYEPSCPLIFLKNGLYPL